MKIHHIYPKRKVKRNEVDKKADCTKCGHAHYKGEHIYDCDAKDYDVKTLSCYEPRLEKGGAE